MSQLPAPAAVQQLHHNAYKAKDAEETRHFYEDILGLPLVHVISARGWGWMRCGWRA
jgi:glyoxylase I family protein